MMQGLAHALGFWEPLGLSGSGDILSTPTKAYNDVAHPDKGRAGLSRIKGQRHWKTTHESRVVERCFSEKSTKWQHTQ